ncbi:hypothetical protein SAMN04487989_101740 [Bizionia echini]|uniref:Uncharacterized protein n=1 Tax=Bizionia echini TaxID=649333 RepID=A0A1I4ZD55_9FLAO|nr:hypothetical protein [Bizionia echini]SFN48232.1 hypothetical protein SAMN04487989_101740 [Bizionia echini]
MKKLFLLPLMVLFFNALLAQKTLYVYNFSSYPIEMGSLATLPNNAITPGNPGNTGCQIQYPNLYGSVGYILPAGNTYVLENLDSATRFPFYSPDSVPEITQWLVSTSSTNTFSLNSTNSWLAYGNGQQFHYLKFEFENPSDSGGGNIGTTDYCNTGFVQDAIVSSNGSMAAYYSENLVGSITEYVIIILDN